MSRGNPKALALSWSGLFLGAFAWFGSQQFGSDLSFAKCSANGGLQTFLIGLVALLLAAAGGILSYRLWKDREEPEGHAFVAFAGMFTAAALALAIVWQTVAAFIIPSCFS